MSTEEQTTENPLTDPAETQLDSIDADTPEAAPPASADSLAQQLAEARRTAEDHWDRLVRSQAELDNLRRRSEKDLQNAHKFALERFAKELLSVVDSLELGLTAAVSDSPDVQKLREGTDLTLKQLLAVLERFNVTPIDPVGEKFNPEQHQAMAMQPSEDLEPNTVVKVFQKGYLLHDRLLRPAMVIIAQAAAESRHIDEQA